ncbi:MAG TPA: glycoside hydrolase family 13 protein [Candidatus Blautia stercoravium]|nr:glycoside hydrolase family 13 protein [Candidatus Blautia stercoravium]
MDYNNLAETKRIQEYVANMRSAFHKRAVFSDETENYRTPAEPEPGDTVNIRIRTKEKNVDTVYLVSGEKKQQMKLINTKDGFDYYGTDVELQNESIRYFFEIISGKIHCYYNQAGITREIDEHYSFGIVPGFKTPDWAKGAVMYQIFTDRFCNGDPSNDVVTGEYCYINEKVQKIEDWNRPPQAMDVRDFYGGDLQGVMDKLDYLQDLGVEVIYFNPLFVSPSNHKYDIQDYDYIDPHYGKIVNDGGEALADWDKDNSHASRYIRRVTGKDNLEASNAFFAEVVEEIHKRGMKVILDGVFNHCGSFNKWLDRERIYENQQGYQKGAYVSADSPYRTFFRFNNPNGWPYNQDYDGWWGHATLPKLNYEESRELYDYIMHIARKWVSPPYNADGWRLDVAADLGHSDAYNHQFWRDFRKNVKEANPNAIILAEHYGDARPWLEGDQWDTVMNYDAFMEPVTWFLTGMEKHSDEYNEGMYGNSDSFIGAMKYHMASFYGPSLMTAMNELSNHDHSRFLTRTNFKVGRVGTLGSEAAETGVSKAVFREAVAIQMTWPGAPTIYYGDEAGLCGFTDPDNRRTYPWGREDKELIAYHKEMIKIHKENRELITGSLRFLANDYQQLSYGRFTEKEKMVITLNNTSETKTVELTVWELGIPRTRTVKFRQLMVTGDFGYSPVKKIHECRAGVLHLEVPAHGAILVKCVLE